MLSNFLQFVKSFWKQYQQEVILFLAVVLISFLSFAAGFIAAKIQEREPIKIIEPSTETPPQTQE
jgi:hypothetical protein